MSLSHPKNKIYIRFLRIIELIFIFPITVLIVLLVDHTEVITYIKESLTLWFKWFKEGQDYEYH